MVLRLIKASYRKIRSMFFNPLLKNMLIVGFAVSLIKVVAFYKEVLIASSFGLSLALDTYYLAILIPSILQNVFIGTLKNLFIPNYVMETRTTNEVRSFQTFVLFAITGLVALFTILAYVLVDTSLESIFPGHDNVYYSLIRDQFYIVLPCLSIWGYSGFMSGLLEIKNKFFVSSISGIFMPIVMITFLIFFRDYFGSKVLAVGFLCGALSGFTFLLIMSFKHGTILLGTPKLSNNIKNMFREYPPKVTSSILTGINPFVDQFFAAQLVIGSVSALQYGTKIPTFMVGIIMLALGNVLLPHFSKVIAEDKKKAHLQLFRILKKVFFVCLGLALVVIFFSTDIIRLIFENNEFSAEDTTVVATIMKIALLYIPFYLCTLICVKFLTAHNLNRFMAWVSLFNLLLNLVLNFMLIERFGVYGLILATTIVYVVASIIYVGYSVLNYRRIITNNTLNN